MDDTSIKEKTISLYSGEKDKEVFRISRQNTVYNHYANRILDGVFSCFESPDILDIGCSDGVNINLRLKGRLYNSLLGIDKDPVKVELAKASFHDGKQTFISGDICHPDSFDAVAAYLRAKGIPGFHIIHIASVLLHLPDVGFVLKNAHSLLRDDGVIFIQDEDDGENIVFPDHPFFGDAFYLWDHSLESGDRRFARKIPSLLKESGFRQIKVQSTTISSLDFSEDRLEAFWDLYFNCDLWSADEPHYFDDSQSLAKLDDYRRQHASMKQSFLDGNYFILLGVFFILAGK